MRLKLFLLIFIYSLGYGNILLAQKDSVLRQLRTIQAHFIQEQITVDGNLDESPWTSSSKDEGFIQNFPNPGKPSRQNAKVTTLYDNNAIYIGAHLEDICKDSVICTLSERDKNDNADIFAVSFDTYNDDQNAFTFTVTSAGVQMDIRVSANNEDIAWNAVWYSAVKVTDQGWYVEMKIPFAALRFSEKEEQIWGINFARNIRRFREDSNWNYINPAVAGKVNQYGDLVGLKNIKSPLRLSLTPYVSGYYTRYDDGKNSIHEDKSSLNGGMDLKYGINEAFTLDMTLIPDFGQVQSDNKVLNTTPFEVKYNEFRQFFTEGTEIYNKSGLFYSRRIGGVPVNHDSASAQLKPGETVTESPTTAKLLNATKITGRTKSGTGIGIFNAVTKPAYATLTDINGKTRTVETNPLTNYNVFVIDQNLKNNSYINLTNTNVMRNGRTYDANTVGLTSAINTKDNKFEFDTRGVLTQQYGFIKPDSVKTGYFWAVGALKKYGNYTFGANYFEESDKYNPNDLGFLYNNNSRVLGIDFAHNTFKPKGWFLRNWKRFNIGYERLFNPNVFTTVSASAQLGGVFRNWTALGFAFYTNPVKTYDYFEPRVKGRFYTNPRLILFNCFISTDYRKKIALDVKPEIIKYDYKNWLEYTLFVSPRIRFNDKLSTILSSSYNFQKGDQGSALTPDGLPTIINDTIIFAIRNRTTYENIVALKYIFTNRMSLTFRVRHYWSKLEYKSFYNLNSDGSLQPNSYTGLAGDGTSLHNTSFNAFNIDFVYTWVFAAGSQISLVWKNSVYDFTQKVNVRYTDDFSNTIQGPQTNSISLKIIYYLDVNRFRKKTIPN